MTKRSWEKLRVETVLNELMSDEKRGLSEADVMRRRTEYGYNKLESGQEITFLGRILEQFKSPLVFILFLAGLATLLLQEYIDTIVIATALLINIIVGIFQEGRASRAFEKLNQSQERFTTVLRDGRKHLISADDLVPGDIIEVEGGQYIPADARLILEKNLLVNEAALTGEWVSVPKDSGFLRENTPLAERHNMIWRGTLVAEGYGKAIVTATGGNTEVGIIARELGTIEERVTPLQQNIRKIANFLTYVIAVSILGIFALGIFHGIPFGEMLLLSIAIAVATIPAGLPVAVTVVLALGMEKILERGGLVRNLLAAETLGATTMILTDKTGTLTEAKMRLSSIYTLETLNRKDELEIWSDDEKDALKASVLVSGAFVEEVVEEENAPKELVVRGRPIEKAVVLAGLSAGISQTELKDDYRRLDYLQFESHRRFSASLNKNPESDKQYLYITGAPETLLENSSYVHKNGKRVKLTDRMRQDFKEVQSRRSQEGMRLIGVAYREVTWKKIPEEGTEGDVSAEILEGITFLAFLAFEDPIRVDVPNAIRVVRGAGADVIMITGDNPETAGKVACDVGISCDHDGIRTGKDIDACDDEELYKLIKRTKVFARTLPNQKLRIVRVLKNRNEIVAMTGDGVNDAPALRSANIGVSVGSGTEVAKEASDIVLLNNSFSIIESAIEEGRRIIDNLKKIIAYLLSTSFSEIFVIGAALIVGAPLPLFPAQILWANIVEEGLMSFSFAFEKKSPDIMRRNPRDSLTRNIMTPRLRQLIIIVGLITGIFLIVLYFWLTSIGLPIERIRTIMFIALSLDAIFFTFSIKDFNRPIWKVDFFSNTYLLIALTLSVGLLLAAIVLPPLQKLLSLTPVTFVEVLLLFGVGIFNLMTIEVVKHFLFGRPVR